MAEFWWNTDLSTSLVHDEHRLSLVSDFQIILLVEVFGNAYLSSISELEESRAWSLIKSDVFDDVGSLSSVVSDDTRVGQLSSAPVLELVNQS